MASVQTLTLSKCPLGKISLMDFSDPHKARQQRDKLIAQDRMKLALDVATKCSIDAEPVWAALGMALLRMPRYNDAKEKFKYCLRTSHSFVLRSSFFIFLLFALYGFRASFFFVALTYVWPEQRRPTTEAGRTPVALTRAHS